MTADIEISFEDDHVLVRADGDKDIEVASKIWTEVAATCEAHQCFNVLGIANTRRPLEVIDAYDHARLFASLGIDERYRIAWVELNPQTTDIISFAETVLVNRSLPGRLFPDATAARQWLLGDDRED